MMKYLKKHIGMYIPFLIVIAAYVIANMMISTNQMSRLLKGQLIPICAYIIMALSLNLVVGVSGELSLGHAGFMSIGAFSGVIMSGLMKNGWGVQDPTLRMVCAIVVGGLMAGIAGVLIGIPVLRLRGDYLAIVTLAFGEIIRSVLTCVYASVDNGRLRIDFNNPEITGKLLLNGPQGAVKVDRISTFEIGFVLILFTLIVILNLVNSRSGRAILAIRDNRIAAETNGLNVTKYKMMAFVTSAVLAGMAGVLFGLNINTFKPDKFNFDTSINILVFVVLGGIGNMTGSIISAAVLTVLPETLRDFKDYRMLAYAIVLIAVMLLTNNKTIKSWLNVIKSKLHRKNVIGDDQNQNEGSVTPDEAE